MKKVSGVRGQGSESQESGDRVQVAGKKGIDAMIVEKARKKGYKVSRAERFRYRCRYFTDSGIIGAPVKSCYAGHFVNFTRRAKTLSRRPQ